MLVRDVSVLIRIGCAARKRVAATLDLILPDHVRMRQVLPWVMTSTDPTPGRLTC